MVWWLCLLVKGWRVIIGFWCPDDCLSSSNGKMTSYHLYWGDGSLLVGDDLMTRFVIGLWWLDESLLAYEGLRSSYCLLMTPYWIVMSRWLHFILWWLLIVLWWPDDFFLACKWLKSRCCDDFMTNPLLSFDDLISPYCPVMTWWLVSGLWRVEKSLLTCDDLMSPYWPVM